MALPEPGADSIVEVFFDKQIINKQGIRKIGRGGWVWRFDVGTSQTQ